MANGINKVFILGNLGQDPEIRFKPSGDPIAQISVATSESWKDKNTGQKQERTEWHRVILFNKLAEIGAKYLKKGSKVFIEGQLRTRKWEDDNQVTRYTTEIIAKDLQMLSSTPESTPSSTPPQAQPAPTPQSQADVYADDIPF